MKIIRAKDYNDMSRKAANIISAQVILKPDSDVYKRQRRIYPSETLGAISYAVYGSDSKHQSRMR